MSFETPPPASRLANVQSLRGIAALLVVFSHLLVIERKYSPDQILGEWMSFGQVGVDLFFVISGFIMVHVARSSPRGGRSALEFLFARITRIYPLYWLISAVLVGVWLIQPEIVFSSIQTKPNLLKSFLLIPDTREPLLAVGWTLIHEMGFYLVFAFALFLKPRWLLPFLVAWGCVLGFGIYMGFDKQGPVIALLFSPLSYEFLAGAVAGWIFHKCKAKFAVPCLVIGLLLWVVTLNMLTSVGLQSHLNRAIHLAMPATLCVYGLAGLKTDMQKWTQTLGDWSYALYLTHVLTLTLLGRIWHGFAREGDLDNILALIFMIFASIAVAGLVYKFAEKPMLVAAKKLRGKLFPK